MKTLYPHQQAAFKAMLDAIGIRIWILIEMATGLGKTVVASALVRRQYRRKQIPVLFLVHLWSAIGQAKKEFEEALDRKAVLQVLTGGEELDVDADVVFCTFQTMKRRYRKIPRDQFRCIIVDEAHHSQANTYRPVIEHFTPQVGLAMTGTPDRMDGRDIRDLFGNAVFSYTLAEALANHDLSEIEYRVLTNNVSNAALNALVKRLNEGDRSVTRAMIDREIFLAEKLEEVARIVKEEQKTRKRTIIFCNSRNHARAVHACFPESRTYYSGLPDAEERLAAFKRGEISTLVAVNKLNEAVDVPEADLIVFLRSTDSRTVWLQQLGRGLRKLHDKHNVLVLDFVANCDRLFDVAVLVGEVRKHLRRQDEGTDVRTSGLAFDFSVEARDIISVLKRLEKDFYPTWEEAASAARGLGIKTWLEYVRIYREDDRLPSNPEQTYFDVWEKKGRLAGFLNVGMPRRFKKEIYRSWNEASKAARDLGIKTSTEYFKRYCEDKKLPSDPKIQYSNVWKRQGGWYGFLRTRTTNWLGFYPTWEEASAAARILGIKTQSEYKRRRREDVRLRTDPNSAYASVWKKNGGWPGFFGLKTKNLRSRNLLYPTWEHAAAAARRIGIETVTDYVVSKRYLEDRRLTSHPHVVYASVWKKNGGWPGFFGRKPGTRPSRKK